MLLRIPRIIGKQKDSKIYQAFIEEKMVKL
jgi:hypothetical protein